MRVDFGWRRITGFWPQIAPKFQLWPETGTKHDFSTESTEMYALDMNNRLAQLILNAKNLGILLK